MRFPRLKFARHSSTEGIPQRLCVAGISLYKQKDIPNPDWD